MDSSTHGCTAQHADVQLRRPGPLVHRHAMPSSSRQVHSPLRPCYAVEWQLQNSTCTHRVFPRALPQGISDLHFPQTIHLRRALLCVTFASQLDVLWCMLPFVFCFHVAVHVRLHAMGNKFENAPPLPILRPHPRAPPPLTIACYVSHSLCTHVPSVLICSLLRMSLLTQREMGVLHRRQVCTEPLLHIGHSFFFNLPLEARKCVLDLDRCVSDPDI